jgi:hypothetical protein
MSARPWSRWVARLRQLGFERGDDIGVLAAHRGWRHATGHDARLWFGAADGTSGRGSGRRGEVGRATDGVDRPGGLAEGFGLIIVIRGEKP